LAQTKSIKKIRCLQIIPNLGFGGVETGVKNLHNYLNSHENTSVVLCEKILDLTYKNDEKVIESHLSFKSLFNFLKYKKILRDIIDKFKINTIHISSRAPAFFYANFLKHNFDIRLVTSIHNPFENKNILKHLYNKSLMKGDVIICNSHFVKDFIEMKYFPPKKIIPIVRGIDISYFYDVNKKELKKFRSFILFNPSRITRWKGHLNLLKLFLQFDEKLKNRITLKFISNHSSKHELEIDNFIKNNSLSSSVIFEKPTNEIKKLYLSSDIVINSSINPEGFGRTISESLALNIPVVGPNVGGVKEQLEKFDTNLMYQVHSCESLQKALKYTIDNYFNISSKSRDFVIKNFSLEKMIKETIRIYEL
jgi:glycosyltransferase involved in cell wall biosynthesis